MLDWVPSFVIFDIRALRRSALSVGVPGCQKLQMMALTRSGTGCFIAVPVWQLFHSGRQRVNNAENRVHNLDLRLQCRMQISPTPKHRSGQSKENCPTIYTVQSQRHSDLRSVWARRDETHRLPDIVSAPRLRSTQPKRATQTNKRYRRLNRNNWTGRQLHTHGALPV